MKGKRSTKNALISSVLVFALCVSMLIGATFAWFTDTASTSVNKIQAGSLDVALEYFDGTNWQPAEGRALDFVKADSSTEILWEPGCTYQLPKMRVVNKGDLALKYKIVISGINGSAKLNEVIDWTMNDLPIATTETVLAVGSQPQEFVIEGHMRESAGNEYQGLSIDGVAITVYATQATAESDSFNNTYDQNAEYIERSATIMGENGETFTLEADKTYTVGNATVVVAANGDITYTNTGAGQTVTITTSGGKLTVDAPNDTVNHFGEADFVDISAIASNSFHEFGKVGVLSIAQGRVVAEQGDNISVIQVKDTAAVVAVPENVVLETKLEKAAEVNTFKLQKGDDTAITVNVSGNTATTDATVPAELENVVRGNVEAAADYVARVGTDVYTTLPAAVAAAAADSTVVLLKDVTADRVSITKNLTIDGNGNTLTDNKSNGRAIWIEATGVTLNLKNLTIDGVGKCQRGVQVNVLDNEWNHATINMDACSVKNMTYYAINLCSNTTVELNITNSTISGWAAINAYGTGNKITVENSVLEGINDKSYDAEGWNNFCTVCLEGDTTGHTTDHSSDYNVVIKNSTIIAKQTTGNRQAAVGFNSQSLNSKVELINTEIVLGDTEKCYNFYNHGIGNSIYVDGVAVE